MMIVRISLRIHLYKLVIRDTYHFNAFSGVVARFDREIYSVSESESSLHICVLLEGTLRRNVNITLQARDSTARGIT